MSAQVTIPVADFQNLHAKISELQAHAVELEAQREALKLGGGDEETGKALVDVARQGATVIRFCVSNLSPEIVRGWPYEELRRFASGYAKMPTAGVHERELAAEFLSFATEAEGIEHTRKPIRGTPPGPPATAEDRQLSPAAQAIHEHAIRANRVSASAPVTTPAGVTRWGAAVILAVVALLIALAIGGMLALQG